MGWPLTVPTYSATRGLGPTFHHVPLLSSIKSGEVERRAEVPTPKSTGKMEGRPRPIPKRERKGTALFGVKGTTTTQRGKGRHSLTRGNFLPAENPLKEGHPLLGVGVGAHSLTQGRSNTHPSIQGARSFPGGYVYPGIGHPFPTRLWACILTR